MVAERKSEASTKPAILKNGRNAWCIERADRLAFLVDAADYFKRLEQALRQARRDIWIVGWDLDPKIRLRPDEPASELGRLLHSLVEENQDLRIRILIWAVGPIYSAKSFALYGRSDWLDHPHIELKLDTRQALRGSVHQKFVCIDDVTAFVGGIDLTIGRWDTSDHAAESRWRVNPSGDGYGPVHDVQAIVSGAVAGRIAELARLRWKWISGDDVAATAGDEEVWPEDLKPEIEGACVALARTRPALFGRKGKREAIRLTCDALAAARDQIYIETQYLASFRIGKLLARRLRERDGPEIVVLVTLTTHGPVEQFLMGHNRNRLIRRLKAADRFGRLRVMYPVVPTANGGEQDVLIHSKLIVVDDRFARVGSSNLNNRSEGLDTECDLAVEAVRPAEKKAVAAFRNRLLAEHLASDAETVRRAIESRGSLVAAIEALNTAPRGLREFDVTAREGKTDSLWGTSLMDPKKPYWPLQRLKKGLGAAASRLTGGLF